jgi:hypothetical protein
MIMAQTKDLKNGSKSEKRRLSSPSNKPKKAMAKIFCRLIVNSFLTITPESLVVFYRKGFGKSTPPGKRLQKGL